MKRFSALLLLCAILLSTVACSGTEKENAQPPTDTHDTTANTDTANPQTMETEPAVSDDLPNMNFDGKVYRISTVEGYTDEFFTDELTGEVENDAVFNRNARLAERFNVSIEAIPMTGDCNSIYSTLVQYATAGDDFCDVAAQEVWNFHMATAAGIYQNWKDTKYIHLDKPWWNQQINDGVTFNNKLFGLTGTFTVTYMTCTTATYVNTMLLENYGLTEDALYALVLDGGWTLDYLSTLVEGMYKDINGDGNRDENDQYGFAANLYYSDTWCSAFDIPVTGKSEDGKFEIKLMQEKTYDALSAVYKLYFENQGVYFWDTWTGFMDFFTGNTLVFAQGTLNDAFNALRDMEDPFGIVPQPKYDDTQEAYHCLVSDGYFIVGMPVTVKDTDFVSLMTEAMAAETYMNVYPVYYDVALKSKYSKDEATAAMIDLISAGAAFDVSFMYGTYLEMLPYMFRECLNLRNADIASSYAKAESKIEQALVKIYAMYE